MVQLPLADTLANTPVHYRPRLFDLQISLALYLSVELNELFESVVPLIVLFFLHFQFL